MHRWHHWGESSSGNSMRKNTNWVLSTCFCLNLDAFQCVLKFAVVITDCLPVGIPYMDHGLQTATLQSGWQSCCIRWQLPNQVNENNIPKAERHFKSYSTIISRTWHLNPCQTSMAQTVTLFSILFLNFERLTNH